MQPFREYFLNTLRVSGLLKIDVGSSACNISSIWSRLSIVSVGSAWPTVAIWNTKRPKCASDAQPTTHTTWRYSTNVNRLMDSAPTSRSNQAGNMVSG